MPEDCVCSCRTTVERGVLVRVSYEFRKTASKSETEVLRMLPMWSFAINFTSAVGFLWCAPVRLPAKGRHDRFDKHENCLSKVLKHTSAKDWYHSER